MTTTTPPAPEPKRSLRLALLGDHRRMEELIENVGRCVSADDRHGALGEWPALERMLLAHMDLEEMLLFPKLSPSEAKAVGRLRAEHADIRARLGEIGLALELHVARKAMFDDLVARLLDHAGREDEILYGWADRKLPERVLEALLRRRDDH